MHFHHQTVKYVDISVEMLFSYRLLEIRFGNVSLYFFTLLLVCDRVYLDLGNICIVSFIIFTYPHLSLPDKKTQLISANLLQHRTKLSRSISMVNILTELISWTLTSMTNIMKNKYMLCIDRHKIRSSWNILNVMPGDILTSIITDNCYLIF